MLWGTDYAGGPPANHYGATIYHVYMPWREIETSDQVFDWGRFETNHLLPILTDHPEATFVIRPVADYPDGVNSGITLFYTGGDTARDFPAFLTNAPLSIPFYPYASCDGDGPGVTPDWNVPAMKTQMVQFVQAMGQQYDGDPRITAVQVGLLGLWGEWHQSGCDARAPSNSIKIAVRDAYSNFFTNTPIQTRYPGDPDAVGVEFGFHEDYFPSFTASCIYGFPLCDDTGDWNMEYCFQHVTPSSTNNWESNPVSGESPLAGQKRAWSNDFEDVMTVLHDYHFSFLGPAGGHERSGNQSKLIPMKRLLGYNYHVARVDLPDLIYTGLSFDVTLVLTNTGAAPCYRPFPVEVALCDTNGSPAWRGLFGFDLRAVTPEKSFSRTESFTPSNLVPGIYSLRIGIVDQRTGEPGVRIQSAGEDANKRIVIGDVAAVDPWSSDVDADGLPDGWELAYFGNATNAPPGDDGDGDGQSNLDHFLSGTNPTNPMSFFRVRLATDVEIPEVRILTITNRRYSLQRTEDPSSPQWSNVAAMIEGTGADVSIVDPAVASNYFYRAGVMLGD